MTDWIDRLAASLPHVRPRFVDEVREMSHEELQRRCLIGADWQGSFASCLNGIKEIAVIPGGGLDSCRMPDDIRRIVDQLIEHCPITWEDAWQGRKKAAGEDVHGSHPADGVSSAPRGGQNP